MACEQAAEDKLFGLLFFVQNTKTLKGERQHKVPKGELLHKGKETLAPHLASLQGGALTFMDCCHEM